MLSFPTINPENSQSVPFYRMAYKQQPKPTGIKKKHKEKFLTYISLKKGPLKHDGVSLCGQRL